MKLILFVSMRKDRMIRIMCWMFAMGWVLDYFVFIRQFMKKWEYYWIYLVV